MALTALLSVRRKGFVLTPWPWRSVAYLLTTVPVAFAAGVPIALFMLPWAVLFRRLSTGDTSPVEASVLLVLGFLLVAGGGPLVARPLSIVERFRLRLVDDRPLPAMPGPVEAGLRPWLRSVYGGARPSWELAYAAVLVTLVPLLYGLVFVALMLIVVCIAAPVLVGDGPVTFGVATIVTPAQAVPYSIAGVAALPAVPYLLAITAGAHGAAARALLGAGPGAALRAELVEVSRSRARLAGAFESERRRIERDLHDGAQQRLVGLTLQLGMAKLDLPEGTPAAGAVDSAHRQAKELMEELRQLIHGIRPQTLTELGLPAALRELADRAGLPVTVHAALPARLPDHVEATAYFVVAEALTNVTRHSGASSASVTATGEVDRLVVEIRDDGRGGADPARGTGLTGLADRVAVADGRMLLSSPAGGPTLLRVELPS
ncbi:histidine kinase [Virgisporangium aliadipatigenens]|uniref:histidine kinase n=1 Tax=Virgisporangium aliadipatigenens TaxID=741659 RepID=A0A8J3YFU4_9ACTN|nr:histidine kinase [Virgisporangium aliadipatigenens]GIJ43473.1 histidine kinase [Virgisporangium aliadipatigenens]